MFAATTTPRPEIAIVEDNAFILEVWIDALQTDCEVQAFASPDEFETAMAADPALLGRLACVVTDYYFDNSEVNGVMLAASLKRRRAGLKVLLCSDGHFEQSIAKVVDRVIAKEPVPYADLQLN